MTAYVGGSLEVGVISARHQYRLCAGRKDLYSDSNLAETYKKMMR
jgi:hypothetical protein